MLTAHNHKTHVMCINVATILQDSVAATAEALVRKEKERIR